MLRVFKGFSHVCTAALIAAMFYVLTIWIPLHAVFFSILTDPHEEFLREIGISLYLLWSSLFELAPLDAWYIGSLSLLIGINTSMLIFYYRMNRSLPRKTGLMSGVGGTIAGVLGFGCAACGSLFATALLSAIGGAGLAAKIPINSAWLQGIGIALLLFSIWWLSRAINKPTVCPI